MATLRKTQHVRFILVSQLFFNARPIVMFNMSFMLLYRYSLNYGVQVKGKCE